MDDDATQSEEEEYQDMVIGFIPQQDKIVYTTNVSVSPKSGQVVMCTLDALGVVHTVSFTANRKSKLDTDHSMAKVKCKLIVTREQDKVVILNDEKNLEKYEHTMNSWRLVVPDDSVVKVVAVLTSDSLIKTREISFWIQQYTKARTKQQFLKDFREQKKNESDLTNVISKFLKFPPLNCLTLNLDVWKTIIFKYCTLHDCVNLSQVSRFFYQISFQFSSSASIVLQNNGAVQTLQMVRAKCPLLQQLEIRYYATFQSCWLKILPFQNLEKLTLDIPQPSRTFTFSRFTNLKFLYTSVRITQKMSDSLPPSLETLACRTFQKVTLPPNLTTLNVHPSHEFSLRKISKLCSLTLTNNNFANSLLVDLCEPDHLTLLCTYTTSPSVWTDDVYNFLRKSTKLEALLLHDVEQVVTAPNFSIPKNVKEFHLKFSAAPNPNIFVPFSSLPENLEKLYWNFSSSITKPDFPNIPKYISTLALDFSFFSKTLTFDAMKDLKHLKNIKKFCVKDCPKLKSLECDFPKLEMMVVVGTYSFSEVIAFAKKIPTGKLVTYQHPPNFLLALQENGILKQAEYFPFY